MLHDLNGRREWDLPNRDTPRVRCVMPWEVAEKRTIMASARPGRCESPYQADATGVRSSQWIAANRGRCRPRRVSRGPCAQRDECLTVCGCMDIVHAQQLLKAWRHDYNHQRPHGALGHLPPSEYVEHSQQHDTDATRLRLSTV